MNLPTICWVLWGIQIWNDMRLINASCVQGIVKLFIWWSNPYSPTWWSDYWNRGWLNNNTWITCPFFSLSIVIEAALLELNKRPLEIYLLTFAMSGAAWFLMFYCCKENSILTVHNKFVGLLFENRCLSTFNACGFFFFFL